MHCIKLTYNTTEKNCINLRFRDTFSLHQGPDTGLLHLRKPGIETACKYHSGPGLAVVPVQAWPPTRLSNILQIRTGASMPNLDQIQNSWRCDSCPLGKPRRRMKQMKASF